MSKKRSFFLKQCKVCDKDVAWSVKKCPHCGVKNPTVTLKQQLVTWVLLLLVIGLWLSPDKKIDSAGDNVEAPEQEKVEVFQEATTNPMIHEAITIEQPDVQLDTEKLRTDYNKYLEQKALAQEIWSSVEKNLALYEQTSSISVSEQLIKYKQLAEQAAQGTLFQETPIGHEQTSKAFKEMNSGLSGMFSNTAKRIQFALDIYAGSKDATKSMERYTRAKEMYQYNIEQFEQGAQSIQQLLGIDNTAPQAPSAPVDDLNRPFE